MLLLYVLKSVICNWSDRSFYIGLVVSILVLKWVFFVFLIDFDGCGYARRFFTFADSLASFFTLLDMYRMHLSTLVVVV
jgi:hypothetical protein